MSKLKVLIFTVLLYGCGPGVTDMDIHIINGYHFGDSGNNEKFIVYHNEGEMGKIIIDAKVVSFWLARQTLFVSRKARESYLENGVLNARMSRVCEYWMINVENHEVWGPEATVSQLPVTDESIDLTMINEKLNCF